MEVLITPEATKIQACVLNVKVLTFHFFFLDSRWLVHHKYVQQGQNITKEYSLEVIIYLCDALQF